MRDLNFNQKTLFAKSDVIHCFSLNHHLNAPPWFHRRFSTLLALLVILVGSDARVVAQNFVSGLRLLPADAAGVVRIADMPELCEAWQRTTLHELGQTDVMRPLLEANFGSEGSFWGQFDGKIGVRPKDLLELAAGEVVVGWLPFENDRRRPSCLCVVADIRGKRKQALSVADRIDQDLKADGATRRDIQKLGETIRIYQPRSRPGQLKIEQVVITVTADRIIAANRDSVVMEMLEAISEGGLPKPVAEAELFNTVAQQVAGRLEVTQPGTTVQWFVRPLAMGRIIRDVAKVDRGNKVKLLNLLENQGFDAIKAMGGTVVVSQNQFDVVHRGYIHAPPVTDGPDRYRLAARLLQFPNRPFQPLPSWIPKTTATAIRINWRLEKAFWALETLIDEAFNDKIFRPTIAGIRDDQEGPQIDMEKNVVPNLGEQLIMLTDNTTPASIDSERVLVAIEVRDEDVIRRAVEKAMEVEPDVTLIDTVPDVDIWKVERGEMEIEEDDFFDDFGNDPETEQQQTPLLDTWAIAMVGKAPGSDAAYLMFSSHVELLVDVAQRISTGAGDGLADQPEIKKLLETVQEFGAQAPAMLRVVQLSESLQTKYELQRRGELQDNDSVLSTLIRRLFDEQDPEQLDRPNVAKWPPYEQVKQFFKNGSSYVETTDTGWFLNAFLLHD